MSRKSLAGLVAIMLLLALLAPQAGRAQQGSDFFTV
jgi:hypothetical protein